MKIIWKVSLPVLVFLLAGLAASADGQNSNPEKLLISNDRHYVSYRVEGQNVIVNLELIDDFTDQTKGDYPNVDFVGIAIDVNQDNVVSDRIDTAYGLIGKPTWIKRDWVKYPFVTGLCTSYLIDYKSSTGCGKFRSKALLDFGFRSTARQAENHPVFIFTIPKSEISPDGRSVHLRLRLYSAGKGITWYPAKERNESYHSFSKILTMDF